MQSTHRSIYEEANLWSKVNTAVLGRYIVISPLAQKQNIFDKILENLTQTEIRKIMNYYQVELAHNRRFMSSWNS